MPHNLVQGGLIGASLFLCGCMLDARLITDDSADEDAPAWPGDKECGTDSATGLAQCVDADAIARDVAFIAEIRVPGSAHWLAVQELCADRLTMLGFDVELHDYASGTNVIGRLPGTTAADEVVLVGAHYDHIPGCLGADDNASGVAGVLELARVLASSPANARTLAIACWDEEEVGLRGSIAWVTDGQRLSEEVTVYFNYDMIGHASDTPESQTIPAGFDGLFPTQYGQVEANAFRGDFILAAADDLATEPLEAYEAHATMIGLPTVTAVLDATAKNSPLYANLRRSDHAAFWATDVPALFLTDTGELRDASYHCAEGEDSVELLDFVFSARVVAATVGAAAETLGIER